MKQFFFAAFLCFLFTHASQAQTTLAVPTTPAPAVAPPQGDADGDGDAMTQHFNPRMRQPVPVQLPPDAPTTEKNGDDLIVHAQGGDYTVPGFLAGIQPGQGRPLNINTNQHGNCVVQVDASGAIVAMKCEK